MPLLILVTIAKRGGFMQAPINKTRFSCLVFRNVATYNFNNAYQLIPVDSIKINNK